VRLKALRQRLADIDVQLKRRYDLIPNLVETVKATPDMKRELWSGDQCAKSRHDRDQPGDKAQAENMLSGA